MTPEDQEILKQLFRQETLGTLAVVIDGSPQAGLLPFAFDEQRVAILVLASDLAKHTAGLKDGAPYSYLIHAHSSPGGSAFEIPRTNLQGSAEILLRQSESYPEAKRIFLSRFPGQAMLLDFQDFNLYRLGIEQGRFVAGFARAYNLTPISIKNAMI